MEMLKVYFEALPVEWEAGTRELLPELGFTPDNAGVPVRVSQGSGLSVIPMDGAVCITAERACDYFRALSHLRAAITDGKAVQETAHADSLGLMQDMSRNAVMHVAGVKRLLRTLALMGYNALQLYTEETYEIEEYPYFGYLRGRYTKAELKEIDGYAAMLGIEVIPCIQTLAHLKQALNWSAFREVLDNKDILLVGEEKTYQLIDAMLATMAEVFRSRRINIGMDEAHTLGLGKYLSRNGYRPAPEIMLEHLAKVAELCRKHGFAPMMWSDMFFRMAFGGKYYVREGEIPAEVAAKIPRDVTLIYWDYYTNDRELFRHMLQCHTDLGDVPVAFAGGAWRWGTFAPMNRMSLKSTRMQMEECRAADIRNITVTAWGDNGSDSSHFCTLPTLLYFAEAVYSENAPQTAQLEARARACFDIGFEELLTLDAPNEMAGPDNDREVPLNPCKYLVYNDPLLGILDHHVDAAGAPGVFAAAEARLRALSGHAKWGYMFACLADLCAFLTQKCNYSNRLQSAYLAGDKVTLAALADEVDGMVELLDRFHQSLSFQWNQESKPFGFEVQEQRLGGLRFRLQQAQVRVRAYLAGEVAEIPELAEERLPFQPSKTESPYTYCNSWIRTVTPSVFQ